MMLIDRGKVMIDYLKNLGRKDSYKAKFEALSKAVDEAPTVDATPVVHGRWYVPKGMMPPEHHGRYRCSVCGHMAMYERPGREFLSDYCPNCGAKMDGDS